MKQPSKEENKDGLMTIAALLTTIVLCDDAEDILLASKGVALLDKELLGRYWKRSQELPAMYQEEMERIWKEEKK